MSLMRKTLVLTLFFSCTCTFVLAGIGMNTWDDQRYPSGGNGQTVIAIIFLGAMLYMFPAFTFYFLSALGFLGLLIGGPEKEFLCWFVFLACGGAAVYFHKYSKTTTKGSNKTSSHSFSAKQELISTIPPITTKSSKIDFASTNSVICTKCNISNAGWRTHCLKCKAELSQAT